MVSAGSTPTLEFSTSSVITEIRPGEYVFGDLNNARLGACTEDQIALFVAGTVVSDWVPDQVILDVGNKALSREGSPEIGYGGIAGTKAVLAKLNEYHGFLPCRTASSAPASAPSYRWCPTTYAPSSSGHGTDRHRQHGHVAAAVAGRRPRIPQLTGPRDKTPWPSPQPDRPPLKGVPDMRLKNVTALVTGASSGIGQAVSSHFRREGARLLLTGRRERLDSAQPDDLYVPGDLNDEAFVEHLAKQAAESFGTVDVVVLNHGLQASVRSPRWPATTRRTCSRATCSARSW